MTTLTTPTTRTTTEPVVETSGGKVRGYAKDGAYGFRGIPYGASTTGAARFKPPTPVEPWTGVRDATEFGFWAPQDRIVLPPEMKDHPMAVFMRQRPMSEDCLVLNVWTSGLAGSTPKPVIVSLHGGAFLSGAGDLEAEGLAARGDVVVVSVNHRLGLLGHLYLAEIGGEEYASSGNAATLDLVLALEWVRDNIAAFGGDPSRVMTTGCSGGSSKTLVLMGMPSAKGLFSRANPIDAPFIKACEPEVATRIAEETLAELGIGHSELHKLHELPWEQLLTAQHVDIARILSEGGSRDEFLRYYPVVDGTVLPAHPFDPVASPLQHDVAMLTGSASDSMTMLMLQEPWYGTLDEAGLREIAVKQVGSAADAVLAAYEADRPDATPTEVACAVVTGRVMTARTIELASRKAASGTAPVYVYRWQHTAVGMGGMAGARHGGELPFVFKNIGKKASEGFGDWSPFEGDRPEDFRMQELVSEAWVRFAHDGDPNSDGLPHWPAYSADTRSTMLFGDPVRVEDDPEPALRQAFEQVPDERWP
ncbi:MAG: putative carboxylesterase, type [Frankiales bacterium]|nr:putative carboxylesterase, type [Frankiales bacterium]